MKQNRNCIFNTGHSILLSTLLFFFFVTPGYALDITLQWTASIGATGYNIYYESANSSAGAQYKNGPIDAKNVTMFTLRDLPDGDYCFAATAYNDSGESDYSEEVCYYDSPCKCDINWDGSCTLEDFMLFVEDWGRTDCKNGKHWECPGDLDNNGQVDVLDFYLLIEDWGRTDCLTRQE